LIAEHNTRVQKICRDRDCAPFELCIPLHSHDRFRSPQQDKLYQLNNE
jgi:hypothetical protein